MSASDTQPDSLDMIQGDRFVGCDNHVYPHVVWTHWHFARPFRDSRRETCKKRGNGRSSPFRARVARGIGRTQRLHPPYIIFRTQRLSYLWHARTWHQNDVERGAALICGCPRVSNFANPTALGRTFHPWLFFTKAELRLLDAPDAVRKRAQVLRVVDPQEVHAPWQRSVHLGNKEILLCRPFF